MRKKIILLLLCHIALYTAFAQNVTILVNATQNKRFISPYIYGRNQTFDKPEQFYKDAGLRFSRMNGGNNATGYNWRKKITVHPDWYNNVYAEDWDAYAQNIGANYPGMQGMFAFQLLGRVASNTNNNFNDWGYNQSQYWSGVSQNLAGGGVPNQNGGSKAQVDGDTGLFTQPWPADSSVAILNHWFGDGGLGLNKNQFMYWSMDNEADVWNGTHDYAMPTLISASAFMDRFIELAKKAKALYPGIKICGPVTTSEWQWYKWSNESIYINGRYYCWLEYFIKRLGDEFKATGIKLVDVVDIHNYPWYNNNDAAALQGHRIYYDTTYDYPGANGIKSSTGGWNTSLTKEYIFRRIDGWLNEHFGANNGITCGVSEWSPGPGEPNLASVIYASHLGTFANNGVELFSPWNWVTGMWETLHLFSRNVKKYSVSSTSSDENMVSAYSSVNENADSLTVMLTNRDMAASRTITINLANFAVANGNYQTLQLSSLPATETFVSHTQNALKENTIAVSSNSLTITVPALSTTAILLKGELATLPVNFISISASADNNNAQVKLVVAQQVNILKYQLEKSTDGISFEKTAEQYPKLSAGNATFIFTDNNFSQTSYYRVAAIDNDGKKQYSGQVVLKKAGQYTSLVAFPNPCLNFLNITGDAKELTSIRVFNSLGQELKNISNHLNANTTLQVDMRSFAAGVYVIKSLTKKIKVIKK